MNFDQVSYYLDTYSLIARAKMNGLPSLLSEYARPSHPTGVGFVLQGAIIGSLLGTTRPVILSVNLIYFIALQFILFQTIRSRTKSAPLAWVGVATLLACHTTFLVAGGIYDYRIDFITFCLYGIWTCTLVQSRIFLLPPPTIVITFVASLLISIRFFTAIYVGPTLGVLFIISLNKIRTSQSERARSLAIKRTRNLLLSGTATVMLVAPVLYLARDIIYNYYVVGHVLSEEKFIRAHELGLYTIADHILYYPWSILTRHIGSGLLIIFPTLACTAAYFFLVQPNPLRTARIRLNYYLLEIIALGLPVLVPVAALTANIAKSPVVGGIVVVPLILMIILICSALRSNALLPISSTSLLHSGAKRACQLSHVVTFGAATGLFSAFLVLLGLWIFVRLGSSDPWNGMPRSELQRITQLNLDIVAYVEDQNLDRPKVSFDNVQQYLNLYTLELFDFERFGHFVQFEPRFGHGKYGIFATSRDDALSLLADSDIVILSDSLRGREAPYPMNTKIREYWDDLWTWVTQNRTLLLSREILGVPYHVFVTPSFDVYGFTADHWITSTGLTLEVEAAQLERLPFLVMGGNASFDVLGGTPHAKAIALSPDGVSRIDLPTELVRRNDRYQIVIDAHDSPQRGARSVTIRVTFDRYFVPNRIGSSPDNRELVIRAPTEHYLRASAPN